MTSVSICKASHIFFSPLRFNGSFEIIELDVSLPSDKLPVKDLTQSFFQRQKIDF